MLSIAASRPVLSQPQGFAAPADGWDFVWTPAASSGIVTRPAAYHRAVATPYGLALEAAGNAGLGAVIAPAQDPAWNFGTGQFAILCIVRITEQISNTAERSIIGSSDLANHLRVYVRSNGTAYTLRASCGLTSSTDFPISVGDTVALAVGRDAAGTVRLQYRDLTTAAVGARSATNTGAWYLRVAGVDLRVLGYTATGFPGQVLAVAMRRSHVDDLDALLLNPWSVFNAPRMRIYFGEGAEGPAQLLAGSAAASSSAAAALTCALTLAGLAESNAVAPATLSTAILLNVHAKAKSVCLAALDAAIEMRGVALCRAQAAGALAADTLLHGAASARSVCTAALTIAAGLFGEARGKADAKGDLVAEIRMAGLAVARATASGALGTAFSLIAGAACAKAEAAASLETEIRLHGFAPARSLAFAWLPGADAAPSRHRIWCARIPPRMLRLATRWTLQV